MLRLEVLDWGGPTRWRWRLTQAEGGAFVADHFVELDPADWQFGAFADVYGYLGAYAAPDRRLDSEAELCAQIGEWIGERVLGPVAAALARERGPVQLEVSAEAAVLAYRPWELARVAGRPLAAQQVSFVINVLPHRPLSKMDIGKRLRMLAVFSLPEDAGALNLRRERMAVARLIDQVAKVNGKGMELRVVQYGATRIRLEEVLLEAEGWDVVHLSGHGLPAGLILEDDTGRRDKITSTELVELLDLAADRLKLVTLNACESAAVTAAEHLHLLGLDTPGAETDVDAGASDGAGGREQEQRYEAERALPALAAALVERLDCAVLAMRYPVVDEFAIALADAFYDLLLGKGQPVARALGLALRRAVPKLPTPGAPALSIAIPALFGPRAADLRLLPPPGGPVVFKEEQQKLRKFPPQPERFVGRVGPLTRATAALAPGSGRAGALFYGMAGAGKTACALELAYTHEASFGLLVWHQAPPEGAEITTALTSLALDLEAQIPGLQLVHAVDDAGELTAALPALAEFLRRERVLVVIDNAESLLTSEGQWRDARWQLVIDALTGHGGLSRLVLTSRRRPVELHPGMALESVHALSLAEAVLLAREWPHLRALLDGTAPGLSAEEARRLAARTLGVVQGHPKLIELADGQAADPEALAARLAEADQVWAATGIRLDTFMRTGEPAGGGEDYLRVLEGWTSSTAATLSEASATLFGFLCCLEDDDRQQFRVLANWDDVWRRLQPSAGPTELQSALGPLVEKALVAVEPDPDPAQTRYRIHPGVAAAGRGNAGPELADAVDAELTAYWLTNLQHGIAKEAEGMGWLVLRAAQAAAPYLLRQRNWAVLDRVANELLARDRSPETVAALLPILTVVADATHGTDLQVPVGRTHARALASTRPGQAEPLLRRLLDTAVGQEDFCTASLLASDLLILCRTRGRLEEALVLAERQEDYDRRAGYGPWTQLGDEAQRLQIMNEQGHHQQVLNFVLDLRETMATLPENPDVEELVDTWNVRETLLDVGRHAAVRLRQWQQALDLGSELLELKHSRGAADTELAWAAFNHVGPLDELGRVAEATELLKWCRGIAEASKNITFLCRVMNLQATMEDEQGHGEPAIALSTDSLRLSYVIDDPGDIAINHHNLANYLTRYDGDPRQVWAHRLAAAVITFQTGSGLLAGIVDALGSFLPPNKSTPASFTHVSEIVDRVQGVHLAELLDRLPQRAPGGQGAVEEVLRLAGEREANRRQRLVDWWEPVLSALVAAQAGGVDAAQAAAVLEETLARRGEQGAWVALVGRLRRIAAGERDPALAGGLDEIDTVIVGRAVEALAGTIQIDAQAWRAFMSTAAPEPDAGEEWAALAAAVAAMARGDADARAEVEPVLTEMAADPQWELVAGRLRQMLAGERGPELTEGLDEVDTALVSAVLNRLAEPRELSDAGPASDPWVDNEEGL